jgi:uncharacterized protein YndB with AHSA1/START domain
MQLDDVVPAPDHVTSQSREIAAPPSVVWDELHKVTLSSLPLSSMLIGVRFLPALLMRGRRDLPLDRNFVDVMPIPVLSSESPSELVYGGLLQPWRMLGGEQAPRLDAAALSAWNEPGWVKTAMEFRLTPTADGTTLHTETRVVATDASAKLLFSGYWIVVRAGSSAIRREVLALVAARAEARAPSAS